MKKNFLSKILVILLLAAMSLTLFACNKDKEIETGGTTDETPRTSSGTYLARGIKGAVETLDKVYNDFEATGVMGLKMQSLFSLTKNGKTESYNIDGKGNTNFFEGADGNYSTTNAFNLKIGQKESELFSFVYENDKVYLDFDGKKILLDGFNIAAALGGKDKLFPKLPAGGEDKEEPDIVAELLKSIEEIAGMLDAVLVEAGQDTYNAETNTISVSFTENVASVAIPLLMGKVDEILINNDINMQELIDKAVQKLDPDGKLYYFDLLASSFNSNYLQHITFSSAEKANRALDEFQALKIADVSKENWKSCTLFVDENNPNAIFTDVRVFEDGSLDYNKKFSMPKSIPSLYSTTERELLFPKVQFSLSIDLDANNKLEAISFSLGMPEQTITLKEIESVTYERFVKTAATDKKPIVYGRKRTIIYTANTSSVNIGSTKEMKLEAFGVNVGTAMEFDNEISADLVADGDKENYVSSNIVNTKTNGGLTFDKVDGGKVNYLYELNANLNPYGFVPNSSIINPINILYKANTLAEKTNLISQLKLAIMQAGYFDFVVYEVNGETKVEKARAFFNPDKTGNTNVYINFRGEKYTLDIVQLVDDILMDRNNSYNPITPTAPVSFANKPLGDIDIVDGNNIVEISDSLIKAIKGIMAFFEKPFDQIIADIWTEVVETAVNHIFVDEEAQTATMNRSFFDLLRGDTSMIASQLAKNIIGYIGDQIFSYGDYVSLTVANVTSETYGAPTEFLVSESLIDSYKDAKKLTYVKDLKPIGEGLRPIPPTPPTV